MMGDWLLARFSLRSQLWFRWTGKGFETAISHTQTVGENFDTTETKKTSRLREAYFLSLDYVSIKKEALSSITLQIK